MANDDIEGMALVFAEHGDDVAAVISEPVQGAGGVHPPVDGYLEGVRRLCDQHGSLLIFDEVICGFGRTGSWFGAQTFAVKPDLMTFAKGVTSGYLPLSGVIVSEERRPRTRPSPASCCGTATPTRAIRPRRQPGSPTST